MEDCIFCKIVVGEVPCHRVWEDTDHLAFLDIFPNTQGFTVVITKEHYPSDPLKLSEDVYDGLMKATREVGDKLVKTFEDVARVGIMIEGTGVDHVHVKLVPMHGTAEADWEKYYIDESRFFEKYPGFISSHTSSRADDTALSHLAEKIRMA